MGKAALISGISPVGATMRTRLRAVVAKVEEKTKAEAIKDPETNRHVQKVKMPVRLSATRRVQKWRKGSAGSE